MARILIGYGIFAGHAIPELPEKTLGELAIRYPLASDRYDPSDSHSLLIALAVHEEIRRREKGGQIKKRTPSLKEMASDIVKQGFRHLSKTHHPDRNGSAEAQRRLIEARDHLLSTCGDLREDNYDSILIPDPGPEISDEDIPF